MAQRNKLVLVLLVIALVIVFAGIIFWIRSNNGVTNTTGSMVATSSPSQVQTRAPAPQNVSVPDKGSSSAPINVAVPQVEAVANPTSNASYRSFALTETSNAFSPNTVIVNVGDSVDMMITAAGGNYDFTQPDYGFHVQLPEGKQVKIDFQATAAGKFTFYCSSCGGPGAGPLGYIEVVPVKN